MEIFAKEIALTKEEEEFSAYHLLHILSSILNYEEQLEHFDKLIVSIQKYHNNEDEHEIARRNLLIKRVLHPVEIIEVYGRFLLSFSFSDRVHRVNHHPLS